MFKRIIISFLALIFVSQAIAQQVNENPYLEALPYWGAVLETYVDEQGRVDFAALSENTADLEVFVSAIAQVSPDANPELFDVPEKVLAYHINAYNALAMWGVIERGIPKNFNTLIKRASFFKFRKVIIGGDKTDLYTYENKVIRPLGDARIHFVLNCMVKDCPRLPRSVFTGDNLEADLQAASIEFFAKEKHIEVNVEEERVFLSGIMKFYTKDYVASGKKQDLISYVNQFRENKIPEDYKVSYMKYDWTINQQP